MTQSCNNGQSWAGSEAKWTAFKAEISHYTSLFEHTVMVLLVLYREMSNTSSKSAKVQFIHLRFQLLRCVKNIFVCEESCGKIKTVPDR